MVPTKAPVAVAPTWWYEGYAEIGYRSYLNDPDRTKLGKFYRYEDLESRRIRQLLFRRAQERRRIRSTSKPGARTSAGMTRRSASIFASLAPYYLTFGWDETPHNYAFDAKTTFGPIGGNTLSTVTVPNAARWPPAQAIVKANTNIFDLGFRRDTASAKGRWTPNDNWDITADYTHMHRDGTQPLSAETHVQRTSREPRSSFRSRSTTPPRTRNLKAEYAGSSPWGKPFNVALGYAFSKYKDQVGCGTVAGTIAPTSGTNCLTFQNPWVAARHRR